MSLPVFAREFTDLQGRKLDAEIVSADAVQVTLKRAPDGKVFTVPVTTFTAADQKHIADWTAANVRYDFKVEHTTQKLGEEKKKQGYDSHEYETWIYKIKITSRMRVDLNDLRVDYWCFREEEDRMRKKLPLAVIPGSAEIKSLPALRTFDLATKEIVLHKMKIGMTPMGMPPGANTADKLAGYALRIFDKSGKEVFKMATKDDLFAQINSSTEASKK